MVQTSTSIVIAAVAIGSTMAAPVKGGAGRGAGKTALNVLNKVGPTVLEHGLPIAGQLIPPREYDELEVRSPKGRTAGRWGNAALAGGLDFASNAISASQGKREYNDLEVRAAGKGKAALNVLNKVGPTVLEHGLPIAGQLIPPREYDELEVRSPKGRTAGKWGNAALAGGLDFASNAISASQGKREYNDLEVRAAGKGKAALNVLNKVGPAVLEHGLPIAGALMPPRPREVDDMEFFEREYNDLEVRAAGKGKAALNVLNKVGPTVLEHGLPIAGQLIPPREYDELEVRSPKGRTAGRWGNAALAGGLDFASNAISASQGKREYNDLEVRAAGKGKAALNVLNKVGPTVLEHGLPIAGQLIPPREYDELEVRSPKGRTAGRWGNAALAGGLDFASNAISASQGKREYNDLEVRAAGKGKAALNVLNKVGPTVLEHGLPIAGQLIPPREYDELEVRSPKGRTAGKWGNAALAGGLDFASNAISASQGKREYDELETRGWYEIDELD